MKHSRTKVKAAKVAAKTKGTNLSKKEKQLDDLNKASILKKVTANREFKYVYPDDIVNPLARKAYRQKIRDKYESFVKRLGKLKDEKEKSSLEKEFRTFKKAVYATA